MAQFVGCLEGMGDACRALDFPIVSGNVCLYNESKATGGGSAILPTPAIGGVGLLDDWEKSATIGFKAEGETIVLHRRIRDGHLGQSLWLDDLPRPPRRCRRRRSISQPRSAHGEFIRKLIADGRRHRGPRLSPTAALLVALAEMALAGNIGVDMTVVEQIPNPARSCSARIRAATSSPRADDDAVRAPAPMQPNCSRSPIGTTGGDALTFDLMARGGMQSVPLADLRAAHEGFFPTLMGADAALA